MIKEEKKLKCSIQFQSLLIFFNNSSGISKAELKNGDKASGCEEFRLLRYNAV
jgi:hypothetical protein